MFFPLICGHQVTRGLAAAAGRGWTEWDTDGVHAYTVVRCFKCWVQTGEAPYEGRVHRDSLQHGSGSAHTRPGGPLGTTNSNDVSMGAPLCWRAGQLNMQAHQHAVPGHAHTKLCEHRHRCTRGLPAAHGNTCTNRGSGLYEHFPTGNSQHLAGRTSNYCVAACLTGASAVETRAVKWPRRSIVAGSPPVCSAPIINLLHQHKSPAKSRHTTNAITVWPERAQDAHCVQVQVQGATRGSRPAVWLHGNT